LATACFKEGTVLGDFMPLTVDYKEYTYAGGRIPGGFFKREGRPTEKEILTSRLIDRPLRPSFTEGYRQETQIIALVLSADGENDPDVLAINAASAALAISEIPFVQPISAVRVGYLDGQIVINPTNSQRDLSDLDLVVAGTADAIVMVESGAREVDENIVLDAPEAAHNASKSICSLQSELRDAAGKPKTEATAGSSLKSARSTSTSASFLAPTDRRSSRAARPRHSSRSRSVLHRKRRRSRTSKARRSSASCCTTTSRRSRLAK